MRSKLTVAIPTHNRASTLRQTLESVCALEFTPDMDAECVVVDNNSTDHTEACVDEIARRAPIPMRRAFEPRTGSSFARNRAVDEARGDFIFFLDDDVLAEPDWAREMLEEIGRRGLDAACGAVLPRWLRPPPRWLGPRLYPKLSVHAPELVNPSAPGAMEAMDNYFSANVGFRRDTFSRFGGFREDLGVMGHHPVGGEETELFERIVAGGGKMGFARQARVHHLVGPERMTASYLRRKSFTYGMGSAYARGRTHNHLDKLVKNGWRMVVATAKRDAASALYHQLECVNFLGYWRGRLSARGGRTRPSS